METEKLNDFYKYFVDSEILYYSDPKQFKKFIIVKLLMVLKSVILDKKLYLLYHKFSL